jgi:sulfur relay (sulfurtransferase) DsrC/TusE family protein
MNEDITPKNYIFTDPYRTKEILWDAYEGFIEKFSLAIINYNDIITKYALDRHAQMFYYESKDFYEEFEKELGKEKINTITYIMENMEGKERTLKDYRLLRKFFSKFMTKSGIRKIVKEEEDFGQSIRNNR